MNTLEGTVETILTDYICWQVEAYQVNIIMPNKHTESFNKMYNGHLIESETYVGGHVEALQAGVYRSDIPNQFNIVPQTAQKLIDDLDAALKFSIEVEGKLSMDDVTNYEEVSIVSHPIHHPDLDLEGSIS